MSNTKHSPPTAKKTCRVIVHQARNLIQKGKDSSWNNAFVIIALGKDKFITSVAEKSQGPRWNEECELAVNKDDNLLDLTVLHRAMVLDDFLGQLSIPVADLEVGKVVKKWYRLCNKPSKGKKEAKERGELELTIQLKQDFPAATFSTSERSSQRSKAKRSSSLRENAPPTVNLSCEAFSKQRSFANEPGYIDYSSSTLSMASHHTGIRSKLKLPRLRSYSVVDKDEEWLENGALGREKSDSNDSGKASDSLASDSPNGSVSRLSAPFGSSHDASHRGSSSQSEMSCVVVDCSPSTKGKPSVKKSSSFKKRVKSAVGSALKKGKNNDKTDTSSSSVGEFASSTSKSALNPGDHHSITQNEIDFLERLRGQDNCLTTDLARKNCYRGCIASAIDLHDSQSGSRNKRPVSYPMRAISEEYIPLEMRKTGTSGRRDVVAEKKQVVSGHDDDSQASGTGSQEGSPSLSQTGSHISRDSRLRHSFRSGLPSLKNSTVSVTFDPSTESGYGTNPCTPKSKAGSQTQDGLPVRFLSLSKEELVRRLVMLDYLLTERKGYIRELENYIDNLLLKVMLESPLLLDQDYTFQ